MEDTDPKSSASAAAIPYAFFLFLLEALLQFLVLVFALNMLDSVPYMQLAILSALDVFSYSSYIKMLFTFSLLNCMACFITTILVMLYLIFMLIKSFGKLLIFPTHEGDRSIDLLCFDRRSFRLGGTVKPLDRPARPEQQHCSVSINGRERRHKL